MPSPFPGMDPYIEQSKLWVDFHNRLADELDPPLVTSTVTLDEPLELLSVEIRRSDSELLVIAIEILSPVNKLPSHDAYTDYLRKRRDLLRSTVHLIEIDFLRGGRVPPLQQAVPVAPYYVTLCHADRRPYVSVWPIALPARLPVIGVPLSYPDPDVALDLGKVVAAVYERGGYDVQIDYREGVPLPPLTVDEAQWVADLLEPYQ